MKCRQRDVGVRQTAAAAMVLAVALSGGALYGDDYYTSVPFLPSVLIGPDATGATPADTVYGKEYSHTNWFRVYSGLGDPNVLNVEDHDAFASPDPLQVVSWDGIPGPIGGNSGSVDGFDYGVPGFNFPEGQIDALANHGDFLFRQIVRNEATLLFSVTADLDASSVIPPPGGGPPTIVTKAHVHFEPPAGPSPLDTWALIEAPPAGPVGAPGPGVNHHVVEDLDALEVWGPEPPSHRDRDTPVKEGYIGGFGGGPNTADADRFSLDFDAGTGTSVWAYDISTATVSPFIPHSEIVAAVEDLFLSPLGDGFTFDRETRDRIDVDGTIVRDLATDPTIGTAWDVGDELLFTIDPIFDGAVLDAAGAPVGAAPPIDGGEIMHLVKTAPGLGPGTFTVSFLSHGGHLWDTAFDVSGTFGYYYEDVDALEAVGTLDGDTEIDTPEPSTLVLAVVGLLGLAVYARRRKR